MKISSKQVIQIEGDDMTGAWCPSIVKVNDHQFYFFGGGGEVRAGELNDIHILNLCNMSWETVQIKDGVPPCKRYGHTTNLWKNRYLVVFGGCDESQEYCNDIHLYDIKKQTWFQPTVKGQARARYLHTTLIYDDKLFVYGGFSKTTQFTFVLDEITVLDLNTFTWTSYLDVPARYCHTATLIDNKMYIFGGKDHKGNYVCDLFMIHLDQPPYEPSIDLLENKLPPLLIRRQTFCEAAHGKLFVSGCHKKDDTSKGNYGLSVLDLATLEWQRQECDSTFEKGVWNYFTIINENSHSTIMKNLNNHNKKKSYNDDVDDDATTLSSSMTKSHNNYSLFFLGNTDLIRPQGYNHFRDAIVINCKSLGFFDPPKLNVKTINIQITFKC